MPKGIPNKRYTPEFKQMVVETMREEHLSVREAMRRFEISDHGIIERWERIYLEEGPEGLALERRGRKRKAILPCAVVAILHGGCLFFAYRKIKAAGRETGAAA